MKTNERFTLNVTGDEVTDNRTGLIWKHSFEGQIWNGKTFIGRPTKFNWDEAMAYAAAQSDGWRLPTVEELKVFFGGGAPDEELFLGHGGVWTSSPYAPYSGYAWIFYFHYDMDHGNAHFTNKDYTYSVRLVRSQ
jgi:hypothetical protein